MLLPFWQEAQRKGGYRDCADCRNKTDARTRQTWACPYEEKAPERLRPFVQPPRPEGAPREPTVCPGYTTSLPETIEIARAWSHWTHGSLRDFCGGRPRPAMLEGVELFDGWVNDLKSKLMTPASKGGLGDG